MCVDMCVPVGDLPVKDTALVPSTVSISSHTHPVYLSNSGADDVIGGSHMRPRPPTVVSSASSAWRSHDAVIINKSTKIKVIKCWLFFSKYARCMSPCEYFCFYLFYWFKLIPSILIKQSLSLSSIISIISRYTVGEYLLFGTSNDELLLFLFFFLGFSILYPYLLCLSLHA